MMLNVPGTAGLYRVSSEGVVVSTRNGRPLKPYRRGRGYAAVRLTLDGVSKHRYVHHLVLEAFIGPRPDGQMSRHLNDDKTDNRAANLTWGTAADNAADAIRNGKHHAASQASCHRGHPFDAANTILQRNGRRACRTCKVAHNRRYRAEARAA